WRAGVTIARGSVTIARAGGTQAHTFLAASGPDPAAMMLVVCDNGADADAYLRALAVDGDDGVTARARIAHDRLRLVEATPPRARSLAADLGHRWIPLPTSHRSQTGGQADDAACIRLAALAGALAQVVDIGAPTSASHVFAIAGVPVHVTLSIDSVVDRTH